MYVTMKRMRRVTANMTEKIEILEFKLTNDAPEASFHGNAHEVIGLLFLAVWTRSGFTCICWLSVCHLARLRKTTEMSFEVESRRNQR